MSRSIVQVSKGTYRTLCGLSDQLGMPIQGVLDQAIEEYRRKRLLEQANAGFAALCVDSQAWQEELAERAQWESTLADGQTDE